MAPMTSCEGLNASRGNNMDVQRFSSFSDGERGGNPAGVVIADAMPDAVRMQAVAAEVGFSETAFAAPVDGGWRVRYFSPESEVPFCGHATIALGAALARREGDGVFTLLLNKDTITVEGARDGAVIAAALQSPRTKNTPASQGLIDAALDLFAMSSDDLDPRISPAVAEAGATHLVFGLRSRERLAAMRYDLNAGRALMNGAGLVTIVLAHAETERLFHVRNPFASGGVLEDPATGAAAAALGGYPRDLGWPGIAGTGGEVSIIQGEDMGMRSLLTVTIPAKFGSSIRVSGAARVMAGDEKWPRD
jgi:PhzF family phenazine biosynthesis protein